MVLVAGLVTASAPDVAHYLPFFNRALNGADELGPGILITLVPAAAATLFFFLAIKSVVGELLYATGPVKRLIF